MCYQYCRFFKNHIYLCVCVVGRRVMYICRGQRPTPRSWFCSSTVCGFLGIEHGSLGLAASTFTCRATLPAQYWGFSKAGGYMGMWVHWIDRMRERKQGGQARGESRFKHVAKDSCPHLGPTCPTRNMAPVDALDVFRDIFIVFLFEEMAQAANICTGTDSNGVWAPSLVLLRTHMGQASHPFLWVTSF